MHYSINQSTFNTQNQVKFLPAYLLILLVPHILLYLLISNLHDIKIPLAILILYTAVMSFLLISYFKAPIYLLYHLVILIVFQSLLVGLGMSIFGYQTSGANVKLLMVFKELFAILVFGLLLVHQKVKLYNFEKAVPLFLLWLLISFLVSNANLESKFYYIRGFIIVFISYFIGRLFFNSIEKIQFNLIRLKGFIVFLGVLSVIVGFIFLIIDRNLYIWKDWFNIGYIMEAKGTAYTDYPDFRTSIGPYYIFRMFSFFFDSITLSYFIAVSIICSFIIKSKYILFIRFFLFAGLIMTFGKGALGIISLFMIWLIFLYKFRINPRLFISVFVCIILVIFFIIEGSSFRSSIGVHFDGFIQPLLNSITFPLGNGLGSGGVYYAMSNNIRAWNLTFMGAESFIGTLIYQLGYPGVVLYFIFFVGLIRRLILIAYSEKCISFEYVVYSGIVFSVFIISFFQEATLGLNYTGILIILCGFAVSKAQTNS